MASRFLRSRNLEAQALRQLNELFHNSYDEFGINAEGSLGYHDMNYQWWRGIERRVEAENGELPDLHDRLTLAREAIVHGVRPDGFLETIGDTGPAKVPTSDGSQQTEFARMRGKKGTPPEALAVCYPSGYAFGRSGWGAGERQFEQEMFYSLRFGPDKPMHGHRDSTSFTIFGRGYAWIVDPGMHGYGTTEMRRFMCSRSAHNVVIDSERPNYPNRTPELVSRGDSETIDLFKLHSRPSPRITTDRIFGYHRGGDFFVVVDSVHERTPVDLNQIRQLWHLAAGTEVTQLKNGVQLQQGNETAYLTWVSFPGIEIIEGAVSPIQGWVTISYGKSIPAPVLSVPFDFSNEPMGHVVVTFDAPPDELELRVSADSSVLLTTIGGSIYEVELP
ncbi:heparinase II/III domain-containing protein [Dietzia sp. MNB45]|uniref:heparinase II/III domain-containing protein n=1 Tax=Dietzia sp. MNB45 TaxID=3238800 RepID=UPI003F7F9F8D